MSHDDSWRDLKDQFEQALRKEYESREFKWSAIWNLFANHPWYRRELRRAALRVIQESGAPIDWLEDVENEANMLFGQSLGRALDLHMDARQAEDHFSGWMAKIIRNDCLQALRHYRRSRMPTEELREVHLAVTTRSSVDVEIDLSRVVDQLGTAEKEVFLLRLEGLKTTEIASQKGIGYSKAYRILQRVKIAVERVLGR